MAGYHVMDIPRGVVGELTKVNEELLEAIDAAAQGNPVMVLQELSDLVGAIGLYLERHHPTITLRDLVTMAAATQRAFESGHRSPGPSTATITKRKTSV